MAQYEIPREDNGKAVAFAFPGAYEVFYITDDGGTLCHKCVNDPTNPIHTDGDSDGWKIVGHSHTGETDEEVICDHCNRVVQKAWQED